MQFNKIYIIIMSVIAVSGCSIIGGGNNPVPVRKADITDGEFLVYGNYTGGEKTGIENIVIRLEKGDKAILYIEDTNSEENMPVYYTNYREQIEVSLTAGSMIKIHKSWLDDMKKANLKGLCGNDIEISTNDLAAYCKNYNWDGYQVTTQTSRLPVKKGYSYWDPDSIITGMRFLDMTKPGIIYTVLPQIAKEPIPVSFKYYGDVTVNVPGGKFVTGKYGYSISDPFMAKLIGGFHDTSLDFIYMEKSTRGLFVESVTSGNYTKLEKDGIWK